MIQKILKPRRLLAILLMAALALLQVKVALAGCLLSGPDQVASITVQKSCPGCDSNMQDPELQNLALTGVCGNHCKQVFVPAKSGLELPAVVTQIVTISDQVALSPPVSASLGSPYPRDKHPLLYRLQRLLI
jgi:hypothetical protein